MNPLMLLMSSFGGGYGSFGSYGGGSCPEFGNIWQNAMMKTMMGMGMGPFGVGAFGGVQQYAGTYGGGEYTHEAGGCCGGNCGGARSFEAIKEDLALAEQNYKDLNNLCTKVQQIKNGDLSLKETELLKEQKNKADILIAINKGENTSDNENQIRERLVEIRIELEAIKLAKKENEAELKKTEKERDAAFNQVIELSEEFKNARIQRAQQEKEAKFQRDNSGSWWNRSKINPKNWFNGKDNRANEAKCIRILYKKGPEAARAYAIKQGLATEGNVDEKIKKMSEELGNKSKSAQM